MHEVGAVHGLQARELHQDHQCHSLRHRKGAVHGHALRAKSCLQASTGKGLLPGTDLL